MKARTAYHVIKLKTGSISHFDQHACSVAEDLEGNQYPFVIDDYEPSYSTYKFKKSYYSYFLKIAFCKIDSPEALRKFFKDNPIPLCVLNLKSNNLKFKNAIKLKKFLKKESEKDIDMQAFKSLQAAIKAQYEISTVYSSKTISDFESALQATWSDQRIEKEFCALKGITCATRVDFGLTFFSEDQRVDFKYKAYQTLCCLFGLVPCVLCCHPLTVCPSPPCYDTPDSLQTRTKMRQQANSLLFFSAMDPSAPLLPSSVEVKGYDTAPRSQVM